MRIAVIDTLRTPFVKANGVFDNLSANRLGTILLKELVSRNNIDMASFAEVVIGNVSQPADAANIAKVIASNAGFPFSTPAVTVARNCASGMEAITTSCAKIRAGEGELYIAGGVESMSNIPFLHTKEFATIMMSLARAKTLPAKIKALSKLRPKDLKPIVGLISGLHCAIADIGMGKTAENLAGQFGITREEQDEYAVRSHNLAEQATKNGRLASEIMPIGTQNGKTVSVDDGIRNGQSMQALAKLKPAFERNYGTVTAGNSSQITDGAVMFILASEDYVKRNNIVPLGYIKEYAYAGAPAERMGLGPVYSTAKLLHKMGAKLGDFDTIELNEAFGVQVLSCIKALGDKSFCDRELDGLTPEKLDLNKINPNGGAIAFGHPVGASGARIIQTALINLQNSKANTALATLCVGGGQGGSCYLERE